MRRPGLKNLLSRHTGVTLVEMLVVVALTVLLMSIVAEVFVLASGTLNTLRGISDTNQRIRSVESVVRIDLANRTIRQVQPPVQRMSGADGVLGTADDYVLPLGVDPAQNLGYFMYTENSPADEQGEDADDWIAFTVQLREPSKALLSGVGSLYYGRAASRTPGPDGVLFTSDDTLFVNEADAVLPPVDDLAGSLTAEIVYFLRRGTLYRRQLLVGVPQPSYNPTLSNHSWFQLNDISARPPIEAGYSPIVNTLGDLSYRSARFMHMLPAAYATTTNYPNGLPGSPPLEAGLATDSPGDPNFPFLPPLQFLESGNASSFHDAKTAGALRPLLDMLDHNRNYPVPAGTMADPEDWYGFPTLRETSSQLWRFPNDPFAMVDPNTGSPNAQGLPLKYFDTTSNLYSQNLHNTATRIAEDALLTNVLSMDIKVWDPDAIPNPNGTGAPTGAWVDLGKLWPGASPSVNSPGPRPSNGTLADLPGRSYDLPGQGAPRSGTWPPGANPAAWFGPDGKPGAAGMDDDGDGITDNMSEFLMGGGDIQPYGRGFGEPFGFDATGSPPFAILPGYGLDSQPGRAGQDDDNNGIIDDASEFGWSGSDDVIGNPPFGMLRAPVSLARTYDTWCTAYTKPTQAAVRPVAPPYIVALRGVQIKIRFVDPATRLTREITIVQELLP